MKPKLLLRVINKPQHTQRVPSETRVRPITPLEYIRMCRPNDI